jgi:polygalacturonase
MWNQLPNPVMNNQIIILLLLVLSLTIGCKHTMPKQSLNLKELNIENTSDATPVVLEAIRKCKEEGIRKLEFPKGTYHFYPTFAPDKYCAITNNDNGLKRTAFPLIGLDGLEIDGNGSEFIFHGKMIPFIIEDSKNLTIKNLSINWKVPFCLEGKVVANNPTKKSFDIEVLSPYKVQYGHLFLSLEREDSPYEKKYGYRFALPEGYDLPVGENIVWNPVTKAPYYNTVKYELEQYTISAEEIKKGLIRLSGNLQVVPPVGSVVCFKGEYLYNRTSPAFRLFKSKNLTFNKVNVYHAGAMGLIAERCENITLDGFNVVLKEGEGRMVTTTADATHFCNCKGEVIIRNCTFENMLDDATNIHGTYVRVNQILDDYRVAVETYHPHQNDYIFGEAGDSVRIINNSLIPTTKSLMLTNVERINEKISILTFNESVKGKVEKYFGIENISWYPTALLENNIVRNNRARSFLISVPRKVIVRNNYFSSQMASLLVAGDLGLWNESGPSDSLIIENNTFENCAYGGNGAQSIVMIDPEYDNGLDIQGKYSRNIIIRNNTIITFDASILKAVSVDGLTFEDNRITQTLTYPPIFPEVPNLRIENCNLISIKGNIYKSLDGDTGTIKIDSKSTNIQISKNQLIKQTTN